jgi:TonB family protein
LKSWEIWFFVVAGALRLAAGQASLNVISYVGPEYPPLAATARIYGDVALDVTLNADGTVASSKIVSGHPIFQAAARDSSKTWKFAAADGKTLAGEHFTLTYEFRFEGEAPCGRGPTRVTIESYNRVKVVTTPVGICDPVETRKKRHWYWPW